LDIVKNFSTVFTNNLNINNQLIINKKQSDAAKIKSTITMFVFLKKSAYVC